MIRAALVTGAGPVRGYWARGRSLCPRKAIRRNVLCRDPTIRSSLKGDRNRLLLLLIGFNLKLFTLYVRGGRLSTTYLQKFYPDDRKQKRKTPPDGREGRRGLRQKQLVVGLVAAADLAEQGQQVGHGELFLLLTGHGRHTS